jgi:hypothetical protein
MKNVSHPARIENTKAFHPYFPNMISTWCRGNLKSFSHLNLLTTRQLKIAKQFHPAFSERFSLLSLFAVRCSNANKRRKQKEEEGKFHELWLRGKWRGKRRQLGGRHEMNRSKKIVFAIITLKMLRN